MGDSGDRRTGEKDSGRRPMGQDYRCRTASTGQIGQDILDKTAWTAETVQPGQSGLNRTKMDKGTDGHIIMTKTRNE
jgi:hypothetical protein